jgi:transcriptional regulator with XRE-family HTH domain
MDFTVEFYETNEGGCPMREVVPQPDMKKTNFDRYLDEQLRDPGFAARFKDAGEAWDVSLQIARLREQAGLSQADLAELLETSQQQISRLESPAYEGHSLSMLRRVATALNARVRVILEPEKISKATATVREPGTRYKTAAKRPPQTKDGARKRA